MKKILFILSLLIYPFITKGQLTEAFVDSLFSDFNKTNSPNIGVLVIKKDSVYIVKNYGYTDTINHIKANNNTIYHLSNLSKQFTALAVFMLYQQKKLDLHDYISKYLTDLPTCFNKVKIYDLLNHTSGIADYKKHFSYKIFTQLSADDVYDFVKKQDSILFEPGTKFNLSNSDYVVLSKIIEKASGMSYPDFIEKKIFKPLKMTNSYVYRTKKFKKPPIPVFSFRNDTIVNVKTNAGFKYQTGNEGIFTTLTDYVKWDKALDNYKIIDTVNYKKIFQRDGLSNASEPNINYGFGWINEMNVYNTYYYCVGADLYNTNIALKVPPEKITVVILANRNGTFGLRKKAFEMIRKISPFWYIIY